jgi:hypothetical protein
MDLALQVKLLIILKALIEVAGVALIGQGIVALFAGAGRDKNIVYLMFKTITTPAVKVARWITPAKLVRDSHLPLVAFFICFWLWVGVILSIAYVCGSAGLTVAQCTGKSG